MKVFFWIKV